MNSKSQGIATLWLIVAGFVLIAGSGLWWFVDFSIDAIGRGDLPYVEPGKCPDGVKLCADGYAVRRTGPNCEFSVCPNLSTSDVNNIPTSSVGTIDTPTWKTYRNEKYGFEMKYPSNIVLKSFQIGSGNGNDTVLAVLGIGFPSIFSVSYLGGDANQAARRMEQRFDLENKFFKNLDALMEDRGWWDHKDSKRIIVDGKIAYESKIHQGNDYEVLIEGNGIYELQFPSENLNPGFSLLGRQILSTFKFIK